MLSDVSMEGRDHKFDQNAAFGREDTVTRMAVWRIRHRKFDENTAFGREDTVRAHRLSQGVAKGSPQRAHV